MSSTPHDDAAAEETHPDVVSPRQALDERTEALCKESESLVAERLDMRIQVLPQEIQDSILEMVVAVKYTDDHVIYINETYRSPLGLQLNRKMRASFAASYYGGDAIFQYMSPPNPGTRLLLAALHSANYYPHVSDPRTWLLRNWLESLQAGHRALINSIQLDWQDPAWRPALGINLRWQRYKVEFEVQTYDSKWLRRFMPTSNRVLAFRLRSGQDVEWYRTDIHNNLSKLFDATLAAR